MKQNLARSLCILLVLASIAGVSPLFADDTTINLESVVIQSFDEPDKQPWFVVGSKFATAGFPRLTYAKAWPQALHGANTENKDLRALGVAMLFDRKEYNWVDLVPGKKSGEGKDTKFEPIELPLPGRIKMIDMWVWSGNFDYYLEAYVRDYKGIVHVIPMGDLSFVGWKNLRISVPDTIPQSKKYLPKRESLKLVKFRIWTRPTETVAILTGDPAATQMDTAVKFYFDNIKVLTDTFETIYDGESLTRPEALKEAWGEGQK